MATDYAAKEKRTHNFIAQLGIREHKLAKVKDSEGMQALYIVAKGLGHPGYEWFLVTSDGGLLCWDCVRENYRAIVESTREGDNDGWQAVAVTYSGEFDMEPVYCSHCSKMVHDPND